MFNLLNHNLIGFNVEEDSIIAGAQAVGNVSFLQLLDVTPQATFEPRNFPHDLSGKALRNRSQVLERSLRIFDSHRRKLMTWPSPKASTAFRLKGLASAS